MEHWEESENILRIVDLWGSYYSTVRNYLWAWGHFFVSSLFHCTQCSRTPVDSSTLFSLVIELDSKLTTNLTNWLTDSLTDCDD
jgi:hypothetical protein